MDDGPGGDPEDTGSGAAAARRYAAPALEKGLDILELLAGEATGLTQSEIARKLDRSVSEIFRMIVVLQERGYVALDPLNDRYGLTTRLFEVAHRTPMVRRLTAIAGPRMAALARDINQSVHLAVLSDDAVLIVGQVDSPGNNVLTVRLGARIALWKASSGRVILAHLDADALAEIFARVPLPEDKTERAMRLELDEIRRHGHEVRESFVVRGIVNISAPVIDNTGRAVAALTIPYLTRYHETIGFDTCRTALIEAARDLSRALGGGAAVAPAAQS